MKMVEEYCKKHNLSLKLLVEEDGQWGKIYPNWTGVGVVGKLVQDESDLGFCALFRWPNEYLFLDFVRSFVRTGVTCIMPAPKLTDGWDTPILSFTSEVWACVIASVFVSSLSFFLFDRCFSTRIL